MSLSFLFIPEALIFLEATFIGVFILFFIVNKDFTYGIYIWLFVILFSKFPAYTVENSLLPDFSPGRVLFIFLISIFIIESLSKKRAVFPFRSIEYSMFLLCLYVLISMIWTGLIVKEGGRLRFGHLIDGYIFPFSMFIISQSVFDNHKKAAAFLKFVVLIGIYLSLTALFEHFGIDKLVWPKYILDPEVGIHFNRARGPFCQAVANGTVLGFALSALFYFLLDSVKGVSRRFFLFTLLTLMPVAIFFTYTRAVWLGAFLAFIVITVFSLDRRAKVIALVFIVLIIFLFSAMSFLLDDGSIAFAIERAKAESPVYARLNLCKISIDMFTRNPLFGVGFEKFQDYSMTSLFNVNQRGPHYDILSGHNTFLDTLAEMGLIGFFLMIAIYYLIVSKAIRLYKYYNLCNDFKKSNLVVMFFAFAAVYIVNSLFAEMRNFEFVNTLFFILAGIVCGFERRFCCEDKTGHAGSVSS